MLFSLCQRYTDRSSSCCGHIRVGTAHGIKQRKAGLYIYTPVQGQIKSTGLRACPVRTGCLPIVISHKVAALLEHIPGKVPTHSLGAGGEEETPKAYANQSF